MNFQKCFFCNQLGPTPFHVTEIDNGNAQSVDLCVRCAKEYMASIGPKPQSPSPPPTPEGIDLTHVTTPEQLLEILTAKEETNFKMEPCVCGMSAEEFDQYGRFGCPQCYEHFHEFLEKIVIPYHNASEHVGKIPKRQADHEATSDPHEKLKLLKLRLAKAIELEEYEKAAILNEEVKKLSQELSTTSSDQ